MSLGQPVEDAESFVLFAANVGTKLKALRTSAAVAAHEERFVLVCWMSGLGSDTCAVKMAIDRHLAAITTRGF